LYDEAKFAELCAAWNNPAKMDLKILEQTRLLLAGNALSVFLNPSANPFTKRASYNKQDIENFTWLLNKLTAAGFPFMEQYQITFDTVVQGKNITKQAAKASQQEIQATTSPLPSFWGRTIIKINGLEARFVLIHRVYV